MLRNMAQSLFQHGTIRTTSVKARELKRFAEKLITIARQGTLHARRQVIAQLTDRQMADNDGEFLDKTVIQKLMTEVAPRYVDRPGGYTRVVRLSDRRIGDAGSQVLVQLIEDAGGGGEHTVKTTSRRKARANKRNAAASAAAETPAPAATKPQDEAKE